AQLLGVPRGTPLGILDAPGSLPGPGALLGLPWTVCATVGPTPSAGPAGGTGPAGSSTPGHWVLVGAEPDGGTPLGDAALLVAVRGERYLVANGERLRLLDPT